MFSRIHAWWLLIIVVTAPASGQVFELGELNKTAFQALDRERTPVLMPIGLIEEHGPYLPLLTDSYLADWLARRVADAIVAREGWAAVVMPSLPIGVGAPEDFGPRTRDFGSMPLRPETKRAVLMDLVSGLGEAGFRWVFAVDLHGPFVNKQMTDDAAEYFEDVYGGVMVNLIGVVDPQAQAPSRRLTETERAEDGFAGHADLLETSWLIYVRPDLVDPDHRNAVPITATRAEDYETFAKDEDWPGYFGSPRLARADIGARGMETWADNLSDLAIRILDGFDHKTLARVADGQAPPLLRADRMIDEHAARIEEQQRRWLRENGVAER